jgi:4-amino-4-deoxy-L-arabinose transferase-like glycosyltransferase
MLQPRDHAPTSAPARLARGGPIAALAILLTVAFTWPIAPRLGSVGRFDTGDGHWSIWCVAWVSHALATDPADLFDANIFVPHRDTLAYSENNIVAGVLGLPAYLLTGNPYATHNLSMLLGIGLAFLGAYALARYLTRDTGAAIVVAIGFAFCPFLFARTAHIQLMIFFGLPVALLAMHRLIDAPSLGRGAALGAALAIQALACGYYGIFAGLLSALGLPFFALTRGRWREVRYWTAGAVAAVVAVGVVVPFFLPYVRVQSELGFTRSVEEAAYYSADGQAWLASSAWAHRWMLPLLGHWNEVLFPGALTLVGGLWGAVYAWRRASPPVAATDATATAAPPRDVLAFYAITGVLAFWISFGPAAGLYRVLFAVIPVFSLLRAPSRIGIVVVLALAVLFAAGLAALFARLTPRTRRWTTAALAVAMCAELFAGPLAVRDAPPVASAYRHLATLPRAAVLELPFFYERSDYPRHARYMSASGWHWQPLINGYSDHIPLEFRELAPRMHGFPSMESFAELRQRRARYVVLHLNLYGRRDKERTLERITAYGAYLTLLNDDGDIRLYEITGWPH